RPAQHHVVRMHTAAVRVVRDVDVVGPHRVERDVVEDGAQLLGHAAAVQDRRGRRLRDQLAAPVEYGGARVGALDDELRPGRAHDGDGGLLGGRGQPVADDLVLEWRDHAAPSGSVSVVRVRTTARLGSTRAVQPAATRTVASGDSRSAGPTTGVSTGTDASRWTGVGTKVSAPGDQTART